MRIDGVTIQNNAYGFSTAEVRLMMLNSEDINYIHHLYSCGLPCKFIIDSYRGKTTQQELKIERVIFNNPATIVFWNDGTKTVVKCDEKDIFSEETGLAMACTKKLFGNNFSYFGKFDKALKKAKRNDSTRREIEANLREYFTRTGHMVIPNTGVTKHNVEDNNNDQ